MCGTIVTIIHCPQHDRRCWSTARAIAFPMLRTLVPARPTLRCRWKNPKTARVNAVCSACIRQGRSRIPDPSRPRDAGHHAPSTPKRSSTPQCHARRYCANHRATQNIEEHGRKHRPFPFHRRCERPRLPPTLSRMSGPLQSAPVGGRQRDNTPPQDVHGDTQATVLHRLGRILNKQ